MAMKKVNEKKNPKDVPLGTGMADKAKKAIEENKRKREEMLKETKKKPTSSPKKKSKGYA